VDALREADVDVLGIASIFTYGMQESMDALCKKGVTLFSLAEYPVLLEVIAQKKHNKISE
jgi:orotate phosphoribosyltransferase